MKMAVIEVLFVLSGVILGFVLSTICVSFLVGIITTILRIIGKLTMIFSPLFSILFYVCVCVYVLENQVRQGETFVDDSLSSTPQPKAFQKLAFPLFVSE